MGNFLGKTMSKLTGIDLSDLIGYEWDLLSTLDVIVSMKSWMGSGADRLLFLFLPLKNSRHRRLP